MKPNPHSYPISRFRQLAVLGFAAFLTAAPAFAQSASSDELRRLQEENAALRKRLAALEGTAQPAPAARPVTMSR